MDGTKTLAVLADGTKIHQECLKCGRCGQQLTDKFSQGDGGQLYHKEVRFATNPFVYSFE